MSKVTRTQPDTFHLAGRLDLESVMSYRADMEREIPFDQSFTMDLGNLEVGDSSVLPLLVHIVRQTRGEGGEVQFQNVPEDLRSMAELAGLTGLLFLEG